MKKKQEKNIQWKTNAFEYLSLNNFNKGERYVVDFWITNIKAPLTEVMTEGLNITNLIYLY